jgi:nucleotide-binding universal stress UspA family protein
MIEVHPSLTGETMSDPSDTRRIVVGYDGSPASRTALSLAIDRIGGGKLFVVHAYDAPADFWGSEHYQELLDRGLQRGRSVLDRVAIDGDPRIADLDHELELIAGRPAEVIARVAEAREADEIIIGTRGFGAIRAVIGSVAHELLHEAACPVTVIPTAALDRTADSAHEVHSTSVRT